MSIGKTIASTLAGLVFVGSVAGGGYYAYKQIKDS